MPLSLSTGLHISISSLAPLFSQDRVDGEAAALCYTVAAAVLLLVVHRDRGDGWGLRDGGGQLECTARIRLQVHGMERGGREHRGGYVGM